MTAADTSAGRRRGFGDSGLACLFVIMVCGGVALGIHIPNYLHQDVAFLTWTADQVMRGAVFGRDVYDVNPPLSFLIYVPAALLGRVIGFDPAIKIWVVLLASLSIACVWQTADKSFRLPVIIALGVFFALAFPREFGQREQFALLLTAPYVAGNADRRWLSVVVGIMAGIGFAMKPYFLVPLLLVFATRRKLRTEEWVIMATGLCYALGLWLFFQPYLLEFLPKTAALYWATTPKPMLLIISVLMMVPAMVAAQYWIAAPQRGTAGYAMAALGFAIAVILHRKGFPYHFLPPFGFLALYLAAMLENKRRLAQFTAALFLVLLTVRMATIAVPWFRDAEGRRQAIPVLLAEIDSSGSFTVLAAYNFPAFPTAILTDVPFVGMSPVNNYISAVGDLETGFVQGDAREVSGLALAQAMRELERRPDLVIVDTDWSGLSGRRAPFDGLAWFKRDPQFSALWQDYVLSKQWGDYQFYRRK